MLVILKVIENVNWWAKLTPVKLFDQKSKLVDRREKKLWYLINDLRVRLLQGFAFPPTNQKEKKKNLVSFYYPV